MNWQTDTLENLSQRVIVGIASSVTDYYRKKGVPIIRNLNIKPNKLDESDLLYIDPKLAEANKSKAIKFNDVLTVRTGNVGQACLVPKHLDNAQTFTTLIITTDASKLNPSFLCHHINSYLGQMQVKRLTGDSGRGNLNAGELANYTLEVPSLFEQKQIAYIIDLWDSSIELLENLIAAKTRLKHGLAQQLLTGKKRFREFVNLRWKQITFEQIFSDATEKNFKNEINNVITVGKYAIRPQIEHFYRSMASKNLSDYNIIKKGNFVYDPMSAYYGSFGRYELDDIGIVSPVYRVLNVNNEISSEFIKHLIKSYQITYQIDSKSSQGNKPGKRRGISKEAFNSISVFLPPLEEQRKIADVLNACDKEIELLNKQLELVKKQKQGLMQKLLTGQIRVM